MNKCMAKKQSQTVTSTSKSTHWQRRWPPFRPRSGSSSSAVAASSAPAAPGILPSSAVSARHRRTPVRYVLTVAKARNSEKSAVMSHSGDTTLHTTPALTPRSRHGCDTTAMP